MQRGLRLNSPRQAVLVPIRMLWLQAKLAFKALVM